MERNNKTSNTPEVNVEKKVMQKIMDGKIKIKHPSVLFVQKIWRYLIIFSILVLVFGVGFFLTEKFIWK